MANSNHDVARRFMLQAVQEWGQSEAERIGAVQAALDAVGFQATATCGPVFGGIWLQKCEGQDGDAASAWLDELTKTLPRGEYNREVKFIADALDRTQAKRATTAAEQTQ